MDKCVKEAYGYSCWEKECDNTRRGLVIGSRGQIERR